MKKVGIITYHSAYNFGSCLQAYATVKGVESLGYEATVLNYRPTTQYAYYRTFHFDRGLRSLVKSMMYLPKMGQYRKRKQRYEAFIASLPLTREVREPGECDIFQDGFDCYLSGSDQIWNKHSNELKGADWSYMDPYLLAFTPKKKISYASSIVNMTDEELGVIAPKISLFSHIASREAKGAERIAGMIGRPVDAVVDPTLLLGKEEWEREMGELPKKLQGKPYILYYTLQGVREVKEALADLKRLVEGTPYKVVVITPLAPVKTAWAYHMEDAGPQEFLRLIHDAACILTNSYHGTLFSLNFQKNFYAIRPQGRRDDRMSEILTPLGLEHRMIDRIQDGDLTRDIDCYPEVGEKKARLRAASLAYLERALSQEK